MYLDVIKIMVTAVVWILIATTFLCCHYKRQMIFILVTLISLILGAVLWKNAWLAYGAIVGVSLVVICLFWNYIKRYLTYKNCDNGGTVFENKRILVVVPHEDDDLNLTADLLESFVYNGCVVKIIFTTNGDYLGNGEIRIREAIEVCKMRGLSEDNIIFLGYGDKWKPIKKDDGREIKHIYDADDNEEMISHIGRTETYGVSEHGAYVQGEKYTRKNIIKNLQMIIENELPDIIFSVDNDIHEEHRATSLFLEESISNVLKKKRDYYPKVYKGYCYTTGYYSEEDFFDELNIKSSVLGTNSKCTNENNIYRWEERVRFPIYIQNISRSLYACKSYNLLKKYKSQPALEKAARIINGDRVFWERRTDNLLLNARVYAKTGTGVEYLNDFIIQGIEEITRKEIDKVHCYRPSLNKNLGEDADITFCLEKEVLMTDIWIYAIKSLNGQILNASICFEDGTTIRTGMLNADGTATKVSFKSRKVKKFKIRIDDWKGDDIGIAEIEAYYINKKPETEIIKFIDENGDFVYDYIIDNDKIHLDVYKYPLNTQEKYNIVFVGKSNGCNLEYKEQGIDVYCPLGKSCILRVFTNNCFDEICIRHVSSFTKKEIMYARRHTLLDVKEYYEALAKILYKKFTIKK